MNKIVVFVSIVVALVALSGISFAESRSIDCFDYYKYGTAGVFDNMHTEKVSYAPGDKVIVSYDLISKMEAPIVEGMVRVQIFYNDPENGEQMVDEFIVEDDISLFVGDVSEGEFTWFVPNGADSGEYSIKAYLISGDMFNLLGLSFLCYGPPGVPGEMIKFDVVNDGEVSAIYLDKDMTTLNGEKYIFGDFSPAMEEGQAQEIKTQLVNKGQAKKVEVSYEVYAWDDVLGAPMKGYTKKESINVGTDSTKDLSFSFPELPGGTYEIKITATTSQQKSILKMRASVAGAKGRFIFAGLNSFPLVGGDENSVFFCLSNSADYTTYFNGKGTVEIVDDKGMSIFKEEWGPLEIIPTPMGEIIDFVPDENLSILTLKVTMYDEDGNMMDESNVKYDISKFKNIDAELDIKLDKARYDFGDVLRYTVKYEDVSGTGLKGELLVYLLDPEENVVYAGEDKRINGEYRDDIKLMGKPGEYKLMVRELTHDLVSEETFTLAAKVTVEDTSDSGASTQRDDGGQSNAYIYAIIVILIAVIGYFVMKKRRG